MAKQTKQPPVQEQVVTIEIDESEIKLPLGRPIDPESERQQRLHLYDEKRSAGLLRRGRPADPASPSHQAKAEREAKRASGLDLRRGRPVDPESPRQKALARRNARLLILREQYIAKRKEELGITEKMNVAIVSARNNK